MKHLLLGKKENNTNKNVFKIHPIFHHYKCFFVHIPKTGGSTIVQSLFGFQLGHFPISKLYEADPDNFNNYFKFSIVRNPYTRCLSAFHYLKKGGMNHYDKTWSDENMKPFNSFEDFVINGLRKNEIQNWVHFKPQVDFLYIKPRMIGVDFVGKLESFDEDIKFICDKLQFIRTFERKNRSETSRKTDQISSNAKDIIKEVYWEDFELFGYGY